MSNIAFVLLAAVAAIAWIVAVVSAIRMLRYRKRPVLWLAMNGWAFFASASFAAEAAPDRRRLLWGVAAFAGAIAGCIALTVAKLA